MKRLPVSPSARRPREAFALVTTLLILSLLIIVAISFLSSMTAERQTADAYDAKAVAEQAAQAGVDHATAMLAECFRDFPDSATVWDPAQTTNTGTPSNTAIVNTPSNEGTTLYLRAVPMISNSVTVANPLPRGSLTATDGTPYAANDASGNNPNNPACQTFVLPLVSGVPNGQPRLVTEKAKIWPNTDSNPNSKIDYMNLAEPDPAKQNWTDLNVRRVSGDVQGLIGSPTDWTGVGPMPARAYWVNLTGSDGRLTGRYAYWIDDESFRANVNYVGNATARADNATDGRSPVDSSSNPRAMLPGDMILAGTLTGFGTTGDANQVLTTRAGYPGSFLPDRLAFLHTDTSSGASGFATPLADGLRYLTTTHSGSLNLTRHGTQRLNLNALNTINPNQPVTMTEISRLVETIRFHLPNFGQRFYRNTNPDATSTSASAKSGILNSATDVTTTNAEIYLYKTAANLRDYIDTDDQPTLIVRPTDGTLLPTLYNGGPPTFPAGTDGKGNDGVNYFWAQGKDGAPFIQEAMVRYRPAVQVVGSGSASTLTYTLTVDYYIELWNMSDHDVTASSLHNPYVRIGNQQQWYSATISRQMSGSDPYPRTAMPAAGAPLAADGGSPAPGDTGGARDFNLDLVNNVYTSSNASTTGPLALMPGGVVFKAGTATVITTDPDFIDAAPNHAPVTASAYPYASSTTVAANTLNNPSPNSGLYLPNVYYCSPTAATVAQARRTFSGPVNGVSYSDTTLRGIMPYFRNGSSSSSTQLDFETEITFGNDLGYLDCVLGAFCVTAAGNDGGSSAKNGYDFTYTSSGSTYNDYIHGGSLGGNGTTASESGDPRTNNEQLTIAEFTSNSFGSQPDQSRYGAPGPAVKPPFSLGTPNSYYVTPASGAYPGSAWSEYFDWQKSGYPTTSLTAATAPAVVANSPLTSIGQLGDLFDPARVIGSVGSATINNSRGGGRTLKIGQHDDRYTYDTIGNASPNNTANNVPACNGWAAWRLADVFGINDALELPARVNINGVPRDKGAALRAALTAFQFQPITSVDALIHGAPASASNTTALAGTALPDSGFSKLVTQITNRLALAPNFPFSSATGYSTPCGPFFERGELGELDNANANTASSTGSTAMFGKNVSSTFIKSTDLTGVDLNHTFDRGRDELFRRLAELICTRGDTFTVYAVGQSLVQATTTAPAKITGTQRMRVTFRLVPQSLTPPNTWTDFHPGYHPNTANGSISPTDFTTTTAGLNTRFAKPDRYEVQILEASTY